MITIGTVSTSRNLLENIFLILKHKWEVGRILLRMGHPILALTHDMSKFFPGEIMHTIRVTGMSRGSEVGTAALLTHRHRNKHHWSHWVLVDEDYGIAPQEIPRKYVDEMVADWMGAAKVQDNDVVEWYECYSSNMYLHEVTRSLLEKMIDELRITGGII